MNAHSHIQRIQMMQQQQRLVAEGPPPLSSVNGSMIGSMPPYPSLPTENLLDQPQSGQVSRAQSVSAYSGVPVGYYPVRSVGPGVSTMGGRTHSRGSLAGMSRSLNASKASLASYKSGKTSIAQEFHDRQVHQELNAAWFGVSRTPFLLALLFFFIGVLSLTAGLTVTIMRSFGQIFLSLDKGEFIGPLFIALTLAFVGIGFKFLYDAYTLGHRQRRKIKFRACSTSMIAVKDGDANRTKPQPGEKLLSGSKSQSALTRTPIGSRNSLDNI